MNTPTHPTVTIDIRFNHELTEVGISDGRAVVRTTHGSFSADTVVTAQGFVAVEDSLISEAEATLPNVVRAGGIFAGALGNLAQNRVLARGAAAQLVTRLSLSADRGGFDEIEARLPTYATTYADWQAIDRAELGMATPERCRRKLTSREQIAVAISAATSTTPTA